MTKTELIRKFAKTEELNMSQASNLIENLFGIIIETLQLEDSVKIRNFGTFEIVMQKEKPFKNPNTGEERVLPAQKKVIFTASKRLKERLKEGAKQNDKQPSEESPGASDTPNNEDTNLCEL